MANSLGKALQNLRRTILYADAAGLTDGELLEHFIEQRDEAAFAALVRRYGSLVWGVCRRTLGSHHDAEDAFQAAFLVLVRKAASIRRRELLANWLYGVAQRTALKAKALVGKRRSRERQVTDMPETETSLPNAGRDLEPLIDQELAVLPDKYRSAIVLCDLQGKTGKEAARRLKIPEGTLSSRLRTARTLLAKRLARHGIPLSVGAVANVLSQSAAPACVPASLIGTTVKAAASVAAGQTAALVSAKVAALTEGVLKAMLITKLKTTTAVLLLLGTIGFGGGLLTHHMAAEQHDGAESKIANPITAVPQRDPQVAQAGAKKKDFSKPGVKKQAVEPAPAIAVETDYILQSLQVPIETKALHDKVKLKTALEYLRNASNDKLMFIVDKNAFIEDIGPDVPDPYEEEVSLSEMPHKIAMNVALRVILSQVGQGKTTYLIRNGYIEITTGEHASAAHMLWHPVFASFEERPLKDVCRELANSAGMTINIDARIGTKSATPVTATFINSTLGDAMVIITESADLKFVVYPNSLFITTPDRAKVLEEDEKKRAETRKQNPKRTKRIEAAA